MGIGAFNNEAQWRWMVDEFGGYNPLCNFLQAEFSAEFLIEQTGGGCHAIIARLESGYRVWLTMAVDILETYRERVAYDVQGLPAGWAAGVYGPVNDYCDPVGWAADDRMWVDDHEGVARLVREALAAAPDPPHGV